MCAKSMKKHLSASEVGEWDFDDPEHCWCSNCNHRTEILCIQLNCCCCVIEK